MKGFSKKLVDYAVNSKTQNFQRGIYYRHVIWDLLIQYYYNNFL